MTWHGSVEVNSPPYELALHNIDTGEQITLAQNEYAVVNASMHGNLVVWTTGMHRPEPGQVEDPADIQIYDIDNGISRRVTTEPSMLRSVQVYHPYLVLADVLGLELHMDDYYVANLVELGITDDQGNLIAGNGVLEPPR